MRTAFYIWGVVLLLSPFTAFASSPPVVYSGQDYLEAYKLYPSIGNYKESLRAVIEKKYAKGLHMSEELSMEFHNMYDPRTNNKMGFIDSNNLYVDNKGFYELPYWKLCESVLTKIDFNIKYKKVLSLEEQQQYKNDFKNILKNQEPNYQCLVAFVVWSKRYNLKVNEKRFIKTVNEMSRGMKKIEQQLNKKIDNR